MLRGDTGFIEKGEVVFVPILMTLFLIIGILPYFSLLVFPNMIAYL